MEIRIVKPEDAGAVVRMANRIDTTSLQTAQTFRALLERGAPEGTERLVAEVDGAIVAWAPSGVHADGSGWLWIGVDTAHRQQGIGTALYDRIEARLGARLLRTSANDADGRGFLERRGFVRANVLSLLALNLEHTELPEPTAETLPLRAVEIDSIRTLVQRGPRRRRIGLTTRAVHRRELPARGRRRRAGRPRRQLDRRRARRPRRVHARARESRGWTRRDADDDGAPRPSRARARVRGEGRLAPPRAGRRAPDDADRKRPRERADARGQPQARLRGVRRGRGLREGAQSGNAFFASAASTCDVTHTGVAAYLAE